MATCSFVKEVQTLSVTFTGEVTIRPANQLTILAIEFTLDVAAALRKVVNRIAPVPVAPDADIR